VGWGGGGGGGGGGGAKNPFGKLRQKWLQVYELRGRGTMDSEHHLNCL